MSDNIAGGCLVAAIVLSALAFPIIEIIRGAAVENPITSRKLLITAIVITLTGWLWLPWVCYGVFCMGRTTVNLINYQERPPVVIPLDQKTIDLNKVEKP